MKKILYSNGDSFVAGMECLGDDDRSEGNKQFAFPKIIADALNCQLYINNSYNGATNNFIFNQTIFDLLELEQQGYKPSEIFVVVGFTSLYRIDIDGQSWFNKLAGFDLNSEKMQGDLPVEYIDHKLLFVNPSAALIAQDLQTNEKFSLGDDVIPFCTQYLWTDEVQVPNQEARLIALHSFLKSKGYDHIFVNTCQEIKNTKYVDMTCKNFYYLNYTSMYEFGSVEYPTEIKKSNHFTPLVHKKYAEKLIDYIKTQGLIS